MVLLGTEQDREASRTVLSLWGVYGNFRKIIPLPCRALLTDQGRVGKLPPAFTILMRSHACRVERKNSPTT
jgi:hypothetical protein